MYSICKKIFFSILNIVFCMACILGLILIDFKISILICSFTQIPFYYTLCQIGFGFGLDIIYSMLVLELCGISKIIRKKFPSL